MIRRDSRSTLSRPSIVPPHGIEKQTSQNTGSKKVWGSHFKGAFPAKQNHGVLRDTDLVCAIRRRA